MGKRAFIAWAILVSVWCAAPAVTGQDFPDETPRFEPKTKRKEPGFFHRPARETASEQLAYARSLLDSGHARKAMREFDALVHQWHDTKEAVQAQRALAQTLDDRGRYEEAFDEYQYLIDNYAGSFPFQEIIDRQFRIANYVRTVKRGKWLFFGGFTTPERALPLFEQIVENAPAGAKSAAARFYIGLIHEEAGDYADAMHAYETVRNRYPDDPRAGDAAFRRAYCLYRVAGMRQRDEASCREALSALAAFLRDFPENENAKVARQYLDQLRERLIGMYYARAEFYDRIAKRPEAAIIAYSDFVAKFPLAEQAKTAKQRIESLKQEVEDDNE